VVSLDLYSIDLTAENISMSSAPTKQNLLMQSLSKFFSDAENMQQFLEILNTKSRISLRVIDWFITNFSRDHDVAYVSSSKDLSAEVSPFIVHDSYKSQLKAYSKKQFDPFCRRARINFYYGPSKKVVTTVGQMNFFRWFIENKIMKYVESNIDDIEKKMREYVKLTKDSQKSRKRQVESSGSSGGAAVTATSRSKRRSPPISSSSVITKHKLKMVLHFQ